MDTALRLGLRQDYWYPENLEPQCNMETVLAPPLSPPFRAFRQPDARAKETINKKTTLWIGKKYLQMM